MCNVSPQSDYGDILCLDVHLHTSEPSPSITITIQMKTESIFFCGGGGIAGIANVPWFR